MGNRGSWYILPRATEWLLIHPDLFLSRMPYKKGVPYANTAVLSPSGMVTRTAGESVQTSRTDRTGKGFGEAQSHRQIAVLVGATATCSDPNR